MRLAPTTLSSFRLRTLVRRPLAGAHGSAPPAGVHERESAENDAYETLYGLGWARTCRSRGSSSATAGGRGPQSRVACARQGLQGSVADRAGRRGSARPETGANVALGMGRRGQDRDASTAGAVRLAEFVYDSTSYDLAPRRLAVSYPGVTVALPPDDGAPVITPTPGGHWKSQFGS